MTLHIQKKAARNIAKCIAFVMVFIILLMTVSAWMVPKHLQKSMRSSTQSSLAHGFYGEPKDSLDIIAIGNSNLESGFSPMELWGKYGYSGYTCGEPYQTIFEGYNLLSEVMTCQKPKVVLLDVDGVFPVHRGADTFHSLLSSVLNRWFPIIQYHDLWKTGYKSSAPKSSKQILHFPTKGYLYSGLDKPFWGKQPKKNDPSMDQISGVTLLELKKFQATCEANNAQLVLVYIPTAFSWDQRRHNMIEDYAASYNLPFLDLNTGFGSFQIDWKKDTRDGGEHLNYLGTKDVTLYIGAYLQHNYHLTDHRKDIAFSGWSNDYKKYLKTVKSGNRSRSNA